MNTQERLNRQARIQEWVLERDRSNPVILVLLIALSSFAAGLIPITYASTFSKTQTQTPTVIAGEATMWSVLAEKLDTSNSQPRQ